MRVMMEHESYNDQLINTSNSLIGCQESVTSQDQTVIDNLIACHDSVTSQDQAVIIQRAWRKYRNETPSINNNNCLIDTIEPEITCLKQTNNITNENVAEHDRITAETTITTDNNLEMSLSSYSNTDESVLSNLDSAAEDLHSDYDSSSCGREYVLNADDDKNNNYFPNLDQNDKGSDSANSSYYGSVEDALDELVIDGSDDVTTTGPLLPPTKVTETNDGDKTSAIFEYLEDQKTQIYDDVRDSNKYLKMTADESDKNLFTRKNYWDFCNQQKLDNQKIPGDDKNGEFQSFPRENPFGSDFSKWDVDGEEFAKLREDPSTVDDLITWDSVHQQTKDKLTDDDGAAIDLITGDKCDEKQMKNSDHVMQQQNWQNQQQCARNADESSRRQQMNGHKWSRNFPEVISPRPPENIKKECAAMLQSKLASAKEPTAYVFRPRSKSTYGPNNYWSSNRHSLLNGGADKMKRSFSMQNGRRNKKISPELRDDFDVYNIETAMPTIDWAVMEQHLVKSAKEQELYHKRRNDREEIRRKLAMGTESDDYYGGEKMTKKPSLTTRLQSGMNLQICFMNETASDLDSQGSDHEMDKGPLALQNNKLSCNFSDKLSTQGSIKLPNNQTKGKSSSIRPRPSFFKESLNSVFNHSVDSLKNKAMLIKDCEDVDFLTKQARLQAEARMALAQAKEMAHMQMEIEKQQKKKSPIAEIVGIGLPDFQRRLTRPILTGMNVAQLQVIVNDLHSQIETLNEDLVKFLLERDDLHMEQDSMLVDIEDLTRYLGDKEDTKKKQGSFSKKFKKGKK